MSHSDFLKGDFQALYARGLMEETCRKYDYRVGVEADGSPVQIATYRSLDGKRVAQKIRGKDKRFRIVGEGGNNMPLYGQNLWSSSGLRVIVTEGEIDALSIAQVFNLRWPVVSVPNGAQAAKKAITEALEWLCGYEEVVLCFDMDSAGRKASAECAVLFPPGKCKIAELPGKDANEVLLTEGGAAKIVSAIYQARTYRPDGVVSLADIQDLVLADVECGRPWFLKTLTERTFGRHAGDIIGLGAGTGVGKTDFLVQQIAFDVMELGLTVGALFLEQSVGETGRRVAGKIAGKLFHVPDGSWTREELEAVWERLKATNRLHLYDSFGSANWSSIKSKIRYMAVALGCQHIYLDHLTALAAAEDDERRALEKIMAEAAELAQSLGIVLHYVSHLATPEGRPHEEGGRVMIRHFKGSRALGYWSHFMLGLERDQQSDDPEQRHHSRLRVLKDRFTGRATGLVITLAYDQATGLLSEADVSGSQIEADESAEF